jgi:dipeptidyl aminopeptidase/acylaminoacyl peptidase
MKWFLGLFAGLIIGVLISYLYFERENIWPQKVQQAEETKIQPLLKYTIKNLGKREYKSEILLDEQTSPGVYKFHFESDGKKVTGLAHVPKECGKCPVIVQIRGYAKPENYESGYGTWRSAEKFAETGFISVAPDFLGYAESASPSSDIFEERFEKYTTVLNLLSGVENWNFSNGKIYLWGHSNGGQIALAVLEISGKPYPTSLWAPVGAGFPYSILFYMNENGEGDRQLRSKLAEFESEYDANQFSMANYLDTIIAPIQLHQGTNDESIPVDWSRNLAKELKDIKYFEYPGADHNLLPNWDLVVKRDIDFFRSH